MTSLPHSSAPPAVTTEDSVPESMCPVCRAVFRSGFLRCPRDGCDLQIIDGDPLVGRVIAERYAVMRLLGEGGLGRVYEAQHARMSRRFAVKVLFGELAFDQKIRTRFAHEAEAASRLSHPNLISVVDFGETPEGLLYLVMDLAEGIPLVEIIEKRAPLAVDEAIGYAIGIARGLAHAHERGLVHRDLKPENVIIDREDHRVRIVDFGLAVLTDDDSSRFTTKGTVVGTPYYMAPEQATGEPLDHRVDLFALGLVLYEMLAGVLPFEGSGIAVARQNVTAVAPPIRKRAPEAPVIPTALQQLVDQLIAKKPSDRPADAHAVVERLETILHAIKDPSAASLGNEAPASQRGLAKSDHEQLAQVPARDSTFENELFAPKRSRAPLFAGAFAVLAAAGATAWYATRPSESKHAPAVPAVEAATVAVAPPDAASSIVATALPDAALTPDATKDAIVATTTAPVTKANHAISPGATPQPAAPPVAIAPAPAVIAPAPVDAAPPAVVAAPPAVVVAPPTAPSPAVVAPSPVAVTAAQVAARYRQLGSEISNLEKSRGVAPLSAARRAYLDLPLSDAISNAAIRNDVMQRIAAIERELPK